MKCEDESINMTRAWDKEKILSPRQESNPWPPDLTTHDDFDSVDPSSMQDTCHIWTQLNDLALHEFSWLSG